MKEDKVLITGGLGFIGMEVAKSLVSRKQRVVLLDNLSPQIHGALPDRKWPSFLSEGTVEVCRGDVRDPRVWDSILKDISCIVHLAAETGTGQSMYEIRRYSDTNVGGTASLLEALTNRKHNVQKLILASSRSIYGEGAYMCGRCGQVSPKMRTDIELSAGHWNPICPHCEDAIVAVATAESSIPSPASIYAATKLAQEDLVRIASRAHGFGVVIFRLQNVYGEGQSLKNPYTGILSIFSNQLRQGIALDLYEDGCESRDFIHVSDVARAVVLALDSDRADGYTLNVGSGNPTSVAKIAALLRERIPCPCEPFISGHYRLGDIRHGFADLSLVRDRLGFGPEVSLEFGLDRFVEWVKTQCVEPDRLSEAARELVIRGLMHQDAPFEAVAV
jgi:dTDP-L-rhamnose 4-epimerase